MPTKSTTPIPPGNHSVGPYLIVSKPAEAIEFYKQAFGATEQFRMTGPDGISIMHAEVKIGDSIVMLSGEYPQMGCLSPLSLKGTPVTIHLYVENADAVFENAIKAGAQALMPPSDMFWGDRFGKLRDPFGHEWSIATHQYDLTPEEIQKAAAEAMSKPGGCGQSS